MSHDTVIPLRVILSSAIERVPVGRADLPIPTTSDTVRVQDHRGHEGVGSPRALPRAAPRGSHVSPVEQKLGMSTSDI